MMVSWMTPIIRLIGGSLKRGEDSLSSAGECFGPGDAAEVNLNLYCVSAYLQRHRDRYCPSLREVNHRL